MARWSVFSFSMNCDLYHSSVIRERKRSDLLQNARLMNRSSTKMLGRLKGKSDSGQ